MTIQSGGENRGFAIEAPRRLRRRPTLPVDLWVSLERRKLRPGR